MKAIMKIKEKFDLSEDKTVLACAPFSEGSMLKGKRFKVVNSIGEVRQVIVVSGERKFIGKEKSLDQRAFETNCKILLSAEEIKSCDWYLSAVDD